MTPPIPENKLAEIKAELQKGQKIEAIKLYRRSTGAGLAEAKAAVEKLETESGTTPISETAAPTGGKGCLGMVAVICVLIAMIAVWLAEK